MTAQSNTAPIEDILEKVEPVETSTVEEPNDYEIVRFDASCIDFIEHLDSNNELMLDRDKRRMTLVVNGKSHDLIQEDDPRLDETANAMLRRLLDHATNTYDPKLGDRNLTSKLEYGSWVAICEYDMIAIDQIRQWLKSDVNYGYIKAGCRIDGQTPDPGRNKLRLDDEIIRITRRLVDAYVSDPAKNPYSVPQCLWQADFRKAIGGVKRIHDLFDTSRRSFDVSSRMLGSPCALDYSGFGELTTWLLKPLNNLTSGIRCIDFDEFRENIERITDEQGLHNVSNPKWTDAVPEWVYCMNAQARHLDYVMDIWPHAVSASTTLIDNDNVHDMLNHVFVSDKSEEMRTQKWNVTAINEMRELARLCFSMHLTLPQFHDSNLDDWIDQVRPYMMQSSDEPTTLLIVDKKTNKVTTEVSMDGTDPDLITKERIAQWCDENGLKR